MARDRCRHAPLPRPAGPREERPGLQRGELAVGGEALGGQSVEPAEQGRQLAGLECRARLVFDEADHHVDRAGGKGMADRLMAEALRLQVGRRPLVELAALMLGLLGTQVVSE